MKELSVMDKENIEQKASELLSNHNINSSDGFDVVALAKDMGFYVGNATLDDNEDGFIAVDTRETSILNTGSNKVIGVNSTRDYYTKRFIIAHELGHFILRANEQGDKDIIYAHRESKSERRTDEEQDVDYFAACLLMPKEAFSKKYEELTTKPLSQEETVAALQRVFSAPLKSVERRVEELALV
jgi:Predicted Zn peptidase